MFPNPLTSIAYLDGSDWTSYYGTVSISGLPSSSSSYCVIETTVTGTKWVVWWSNNDIAKVRGFTYAPTSLSNYAYMYVFGSFDTAQELDGTTLIGNPVTCGCIVQLRIVSNVVSLVSMKSLSGPPYAAGVASTTPTRAIVNDAVAISSTINNTRRVYIVGYFDTYLNNDGTKSYSNQLSNTVIAELSVTTGTDDVTWQKFYETNGEVHQTLVQSGAWGPTLANVVFVGNFTQSTFGGATTTVNGYVMYNSSGSLAVTLNPLLSSTAVVRGVSMSGTDSSKQLIYGGTSATNGAFVHSVDATTGATTQMTLNGLSPVCVGGFNGLASGHILALSDTYDVVGLFDPSNTLSITSYWCSKDLTTWQTLASNSANNGDSSLTNANGQGLFYKDDTLYMNAATNSTGGTYFRYLSQN